MNAYDRPRLPGRRPSREQETLEQLLRRVNCNDRREPDRETSREAEKYTERAHQLAAVTFLGAFL
ncbi:hypothetical protein [Streptomyces sp. YU58]|uniref:hypothetical protein n=1 Tax=Streptomyces sp. SX92 TaxID=3158972 RepID=UPI0027B891E2|nr:hypothetical protein [Streptomyces coralus]WLW58135.1 hypothetical protein QU709_45225 [Streptomyces coralus]